MSVEVKFEDVVGTSLSQNFSAGVLTEAFEEARTERQKNFKSVISKVVSLLQSRTAELDVRRQQLEAALQEVIEAQEELQLASSEAVVSSAKSVLPLANVLGARCYVSQELINVGITPPSDNEAWELPKQDDEEAE